MSKDSTAPSLRLILAMADDELILGHRNSEWTGHAPILEEDIAFSNIAQDELGHSLVWYSLYQQSANKTPDEMAFVRTWQDFTCCHFVTYPKGDFAYTIVRQYLFDEAERLRLMSLEQSSDSRFRDISAKILREEAYHLMHVKGLLTRLGDATEESHRRMQSAVDAAFPQALGLFEKLEGEEDLVQTKVFAGNAVLEQQWKDVVVPILTSAGLRAPALCSPDLGGRKHVHTAHLQPLVDDLQQVFRIAPEAKW